MPTTMYGTGPGKTMCERLQELGYEREIALIIKPRAGWQWVFRGRHCSEDGQTSQNANTTLTSANRQERNRTNGLRLEPPLRVDHLLESGLVADGQSGTLQLQELLPFELREEPANRFPGSPDNFGDLLVR